MGSTLESLPLVAAEDEEGCVGVEVPLVAALAGGGVFDVDAGSCGTDADMKGLLTAEYGGTGGQKVEGKLMPTDSCYNRVARNRLKY